MSELVTNQDWSLAKFLLCSPAEARLLRFTPGGALGKAIENRQEELRTGNAVMTETRRYWADQFNIEEMVWAENREADERHAAAAPTLDQLKRKAIGADPAAAMAYLEERRASPR